MSEMSLTEIIEESLNELDPQEDNLGLELEDSEFDEQLEFVDEEDEFDEDSDNEYNEEDSDDEFDEDDSEDDESDGETYVVKVDGEELEVTLDELKAGYSRQSHFTRSMQALKEERETFQQEVSQYQDVLTQVEQLDQAWESSPVSVLASLLGSTENPSYTLGLLIKEAASYDLLTPEALQYFGIDEDTKKSWSTETELERLRRELGEREKLEEKRNAEVEETQQEARVRQAIESFENQIEEIISEEDIDLPTIQEKAHFKAELLKYAKDNSILDLKKAYAALSYERQKTNRRSAAPKDNSRKAATRVVSRRGAGESGVTPVRNSNQDLRSVIEETMKELRL
jgi:hypothetical protein